MSPLQVDRPLARRLLGRMAEIGVTQQDLADALGIGGMRTWERLSGKERHRIDKSKR